MLFRDSCYFCTSTFQLLPIISLAVQRKEQADLYIDPDFDNACNYAERIRELNIFCNVIVIDSKSIYSKFFTTDKGLLYKIQTALSYLKVDEIAKKVLLENIRYKNMFVSSSGYFPRIVHFYYIKNDISTEIIYFDDGIGSYIENHAIKTVLPERLIRRILFGKRATVFSQNSFLFSPDLFHLINEHAQLSVSAIPKIWEKDQYRKLLNTIFSVSENFQISEEVIILDQPKYEIVNNSDIDSLIELYRLLTDFCDVKNIIIKQHPRCKDKTIDGFNYFKDTGIPFECICMNIDMDKKILITYESTSVVTPKLLFNQEPVVILLYKLIKAKAGGYNTTFEDAFFSKVKKTYSNKQKFYIPQNIEDLKKVFTAVLSGKEE